MDTETKEQSARELAEMIAKSGTPPGFNWKLLADDIEKALESFYERGRESGWL
jgi:hypothetical protein